MKDASPSPKPEGSHDSPGSARTARAAARDAARARDRLVALCMIIVSGALATLIYGQMGASWSESLLAGIGILSACLGILGLQALRRERNEVAALKVALSRLEGGRAGNLPVGQTLSNGISSEVGGAALPIGANPPAPEPWEAMPSSTQAGASQSAREPHPPVLKTVAARPISSNTGVAKSLTSISAKMQPAAASTSAADTMLWPGTTLSTTDPMRDQWAFRPRESLNAQTAAASAAPKDSGSAQNSSLRPKAGSGTALDSDLAIVQQKIKALAEEVNAAEAARQKLGTFEVKPSGVAPATSAAEPTLVHSPIAAAIDDSIDALKAVAASMLRDKPQLQNAEPAAGASAVQSPAAFGELQIPASAQPIAVPAARAMTFKPETAPPLQVLAASFEQALSDVSPPVRSASRVAGRAAEIAQAIEAGRIDVQLSPIVDLNDNGVSHYDLTFVLKTVSGPVDSAEVEIVLNGSDLLALFDRSRLVRAAIIAQRLDERQKKGAVLSPVAGRSLSNFGFIDEFARIFEERQSIADQLVLTFSQADIEQFAPSSWEALGDMHAFGFRFALDQVDHLSADFRGLAKRGFAFVKLDAKSLINGMPSRERFVPADEACRTLAGAGLTIVAAGLADEATRARIFGFGILHGQGQLFGAPRPVDVQVPANGAKTAAA